MLTCQLPGINCCRQIVPAMCTTPSSIPALPTLPSLVPAQSPHKPPVRTHPQVHFTQHWAALTEVSLRNFLGEALSFVPLPGLLNWEADRKTRKSLQVHT